MHTPQLRQQLPAAAVIAAIDPVEHARIACSVIDILDRCDDGLIDGVQAATELVGVADQARFKAAHLLGFKL